MLSLRWRPISCAVAMMLLQATLLVVWPLSACCAQSGAAKAHAAKAAAEADCCPPGSHRPGQCPLHRSARSGARQSASTCRIQCSAPLAAAIVIGTVGVLPDPPVAARTTIVSTVAPAPADAVSARAVHPDAPPPKTL